MIGDSPDQRGGSLVAREPVRGGTIGGSLPRGLRGVAAGGLLSPGKELPSCGFRLLRPSTGS